MKFELINVPEGAKRLDIGNRYLRNLIASGRVKNVKKVNGGYLIKVPKGEPPQLTHPLIRRHKKGKDS
jgi:hypothetical protein